MKLWCMSVLAFLAAGLSAFAQDPGQPTPPEKKDAPKPQEQEESKFKFYWKNGIRFESEDGSFMGEIGGRMQHDSGYADVDPQYGTSDEAADVNRFRSARIHFKGAFYDRFEFKIEMDWAGGASRLQDMYIRVKDFPFSNLTVGHFREPYSIEGNTSHLDLVFMERGLNDALNPGRNFGVMVNGVGAEGMLTYAIGLFRDADGDGDVTGNDVEGDGGITVRITFIALLDEAESMLLHTGLSVSRRVPVGETGSFPPRVGGMFTSAVTPELNLNDPPDDLSPVSADFPGGEVLADHMTILNIEGALIYGPWTAWFGMAWAEFDLSSAAPPVSDPVVYAGTVAVSCFVTGESRPYDRQNAAFGQVMPKTNVFGGNTAGPGAVEIAIRFSNVDYDELGPASSGGAGGEMTDITGAINWYLNANTRVSLNLVHSDLESGGDAKLAGVRFQIRF